MPKKKQVVPDESLIIKQAEPIVSIEILKNTYNINALTYTKKDIDKIIELLQFARESKEIPLQLDNTMV